MHVLVAQQITECLGDHQIDTNVQHLLEKLSAMYQQMEEKNHATSLAMAELTTELTISNSIMQRELAVRRVAEVQLNDEKVAQANLIARLEEAHNKLLQSEKMASIGQLAAGVAHEINNPIGFVNSNLNTLNSYIDDLFNLIDLQNAALADESKKPQVDILMKQLDLEFLREDVLAILSESLDGILRVKQIVQDLKDFSHMDQGDWLWVDLHKGLDSTLNIVNNEIKYKAQVIKKYGDIPQIYCLSSQVNQVFMNLFINAAQAMEQRGTITIETSLHQENLVDGVLVKVIDNGSGIPHEYLTRIFDPFFTTKPVGTGTGLGLSLSYSIVKKHGGYINVESEIGVGTTFFVWLPIQGKAQQEETV